MALPVDTKHGIMTSVALSSVVAFLVALPIFMILDATQEISINIFGMAHPAWIQKLRNVIICFVFPVSAIVGTVLGIAGRGSSRQLRTPHGVCLPKRALVNKS